MPTANIATPSVAPGTVTPAIVTAPPVPAPSAIPATPLNTLADFDAYASASLQSNLMPPPPPAAPPAAPTGLESPPVEAPAPVAPVADDPSPGPEAEDPEPSPEVLASLSDAGKRALQSEREKRKAAREENKTLRARLEALEAQVPPPAAPPSEAPHTPPAAEPAAPMPSAPSVLPSNLAECRTFDQVDAAAMQAVEQKALATEGIANLAQGDQESVRTMLKAQNVERIGSTPLEDCTSQQMVRLLVTVQKNCETAVLQAPQRKQQLAQEANSYVEAGKILPGLTQPGSPANKLFVAYVQQNPNVRTLGSNWPMMVAEGVANRLSRVSNTPQPASAPVPTPRSAPGAPRSSSAALPQRNERDEIATRFANGTATLRDSERYGELCMSP